MYILVKFWPLRAIFCDQQPQARPMIEKSKLKTRKNEKMCRRENHTKTDPSLDGIKWGPRPKNHEKKHKNAKVLLPFYDGWSRNKIGKITKNSEKTWKSTKKNCTQNCKILHFLTIYDQAESRKCAKIVFFVKLCKTCVQHVFHCFSQFSQI